MLFTESKDDEEVTPEDTRAKDFKELVKSVLDAYDAIDELEDELTPPEKKPN